MPPIIAAPIEAGSGPILRANGARRRLASAPMTPGCSEMRRPSSEIVDPCQRSPSTMSTLSVMAWPESDVPAARNVTDAPAFAHAANTSITSESPSTVTTIRGINR